MDEMEIMEALGAIRRMCPIDTLASKKKLHVLGEFFPSVALDVRRDVLMAANYCEDVAAAMLGDLTRETVVASARVLDTTENRRFLNLHANEDAASELAGEEDWSEVATVSDGIDAWVLIQDDWEVLDKNGDKVRTFADVLQATPVATSPPKVTRTTPRPALLSHLSVVEQTALPSCGGTLKKTESSNLALPDYELDRGTKTFGARKRHMTNYHG